MVIAMVVILVAVFAPVIYPLLRNKGKQASDRGESQREMAELIRQKESSYAAINELEMDHRTGKISETDYKNLYEVYKAEALKAIRVLKEWETGNSGPGDTAIEEEIEMRRQELELQVETAEEHDHIPCPACGTVNQPGRISCSECGADLRQMCRLCGRANPPHSRFCRSCGESLNKYCSHCGCACDAWSRFCPQCGTEMVFSKEKG